MGCSLSKIRIDLQEAKFNKELNKENSELMDQFQSTLDQYSEMMTIIKSWKTKEEYKKAIESDDPNILFEALKACETPLTELNVLYRYSEMVSGNLITVFQHFAPKFPENGEFDMDVLKEKICQNYSLVRLLANLLSGILLLDYEKNKKNEIQNDLSLIKRFLTIRQKLYLSSQHNNQAMSNDMVNIVEWKIPEGIDDQMLSNMVHFFPSNAPYISKCTKSINVTMDNLTDNINYDMMLQSIPNILMDIILSKMLDPADLKSFTEAMVCATLIIDRILPEGAFHPKSLVDIESILDVLTGKVDEIYGEKNEIDFKMLLKVMNYWAMHLHDVRTPASTRKRL